MSCQGPSVFVGCVSCGVGLFEPTNSCTGGANGADKEAPASSCTQGCASTTPPPSCTETSSTSCGNPILIGCASAGVATGTETCSTVTSCPSSQSNFSRSVTENTRATCQIVVQHQCAPDKPGYAERQSCLTLPTGGLTDCSGWSAPYYDPKGCPIPTPVN